MKKYLKWLFVLLPVIAVLLFLIVVMLIPNKNGEKEEIKTKEYKTKDQRVTFLADEKFKQEEKGEYDLYLNKDNKQIVGGFTYNLNEYEEKSSKEVLDKQVSNFISSRKDMKLFKKEAVDDYEDKTIIRVEYSGKTDKSSDCLYVFSVINFKADPNYVIYINEVIIKERYENHISEMINILQSAKLN